MIPVCIDFETYGEAGYYFDGKRWRSVSKSPPHGLNAVGAAAYSEHSSLDVLSLSYDGFSDCVQIWLPGCPPPSDLLEHVRSGGLILAQNCSFEYYIWNNYCAPEYGWPPLMWTQLRDIMPRARAFGLPGSLKDMGEALNLDRKKITDGKRLINKFSKPRKPTKKNPNFRLLPSDDSVDGPKLYAYNIGDVHTTRDVESRLPELSDYEFKVWQLDQKINYRGVNIDFEGLKKLEYFVKETESRLLKRLRLVTGGAVQGEGQVAEIVKWLANNGLSLPNLQAGTVSGILEERHDLSPACREVLYLRSVLASASVKKIFSIGRRLTKYGRLHDLFAYCGAERTGRFAGRGPQPQNLPISLPLEEVEQILSIKNYDDLVEIYDDPLSAVSGCLRALFSAPSGYDLICSDYSAVEAMGLAELAGETWRQKLFRTHGKIYEASAASISGIPFQEFLDYKTRTGEDHPLRKKIGKVSELASGYDGWINAWKHFGAGEYFKSDEEIRDAILKWRAENPNIVEFWGGQVRKEPYRWAFTREYFGLEGAAVKAILNPGTTYPCRSVSYCVVDDVLYCRLPSGRNLCYQSPRLFPTIDRYSKENIYQITYMGFNRDPKVGPRGWMRIDTRGGKLAENVTQAACRDLLVHGMLCVEAGGYPIVLHVHDEIVSEIPQGFGSIQEFERLMSTTPTWARGWPVKATGGWRGRRYRKD